MFFILEVGLFFQCTHTTSIRVLILAAALGFWVWSTPCAWTLFRMPCS